MIARTIESTKKRNEQNNKKTKHTACHKIAKNEPYTNTTQKMTARTMESSKKRNEKNKKKPGPPCVTKFRKMSPILTPPQNDLGNGPQALGERSHDKLPHTKCACVCLHVNVHVRGTCRAHPHTHTQKARPTACHKIAKNEPYANTTPK